MAGSIFSGQMISRTGRYRIYPIIGSALLVVSLFAFHYVARGHPAVEGDDRDVLLRHRPRLQLPAADPRRAERRRPPRHGRRHLVGDLHPPDRRHARHGGLPVDPLLAGRHEDHRGLRGDRADAGLPGGPAQPHGRRPGHQPGLRRAARRPRSSRAAPAAASVGLPSPTARSSTSSTRPSPSRSSWASPTPCRSSSSWRPACSCSPSSPRSSCRTSTSAPSRARPRERESGVPDDQVSPLAAGH